MPDDEFSRALVKLLRYPNEKDKGKLGFNSGWVELDLALMEAEADICKKHSQRDRREQRELPELRESFDDIMRGPKKRIEVQSGPTPGHDPSKRYIRALDGHELQDQIDEGTVHSSQRFPAKYKPIGEFFYNEDVFSTFLYL